ncbi:MAG: hypothetical protein AAF688_02450 [Bacteroidota bacterium]
MSFKFLLPMLLLIIFVNVDKEFSRDYDQEGNLMSEGWMQNEKKVEFWTFYHTNGSIEKKGHYDRGKKDGYWYFYDSKENLVREGYFKNNNKDNWWTFYENKKKVKIQFKNGLKNGFALIYERDRLKKAERYESDRKIGEWTSYFKFKKDNPDVKF